MNIDKTYITFSITSANCPPFSNMAMEALVIEEMYTKKYLGITVDNHLKWKEHIPKFTYVRKPIHKFYTLRDILKYILIKKVYRALVESHFRYGLFVW